MTALAIKSFNGLAPGMNPRLLPNSFATIATNMRMGYGDLRPWNSPATVMQPTKTGVRQAMYRFGQTLTSDSQYWFVWDVDVDVIRAPIDSDTSERTYYTGDGAPKKTDNYLGLHGGTNYPVGFYDLGVPKPDSAPTGLVTGVATAPTTDPVNAVAYIETFVTAWGEESAPSDASDVYSFQPGQQVELELSTVPTGAHNIITRRLYRSNGGTTSINYQFVTEIAAGFTQYNDAAGSDELGETCKTFGWDGPPDDLQGLRLMANGIGVGFRANEVWFSEPYALYAWKPNNVLSTESPITGLQTFDQSVLVGTREQPYIVTGTDPSTLTSEKLKQRQACVSKRSMVSMLDGVVYASPDGLCLVAPGGFAILTKSILNREDWQKFNPSSIHAYEIDGRYVAFYDTGTVQGCLVFTFGDQASFAVLDLYATAGYVDKFKDALFICRGAAVEKFDAGAFLRVDWQSKTFELPFPGNMAWGMVLAQTYPVTFTLVADGREIITQDVFSREPFRLPGDYRARDLIVRVSGSTVIEQVVLAQTAAELKAI